MDKPIKKQTAMVNHNVRLTNEQWVKLNKIAAAHNATASDVTRWLIDQAVVPKKKKST